MSPAGAVATVGGIGLLRPAPGTWGSLAALPLAWGVLTLGGPWALLLGIGLAAGAGVWAIERYQRETGAHDPKEAVIDEVAGQWIALLPVAFGAARAGADLLALWPGWVAAFVLFRLFDIWKPGPVGWADRKGTASSVMLDDLIAGGFAALGVAALAALAHLVLLA
ncbi:phosphatidylglycerophosphatase A [Hasllibacter halocynthiae]|uniref:Phosphatidylglycerophosphatase A n=1 Tax=Hasllibacter halocynthiae TaxID=595589 RepID=A0A2T0X8H8_9RHOB|nr:phosphatidylglycerophosphatase A [Hasllibacter halocynthiae]PRY95174.1 phosphatidylglycerophosphatase A [Hasllibacter halocynthiae]